MKVNEKQSQKKYDLCVGNPPYQMTTTRAEAVTNVFQLFQQSADSCAHSVSLIYPGARWMNRSGRHGWAPGHEHDGDVPVIRWNDGDLLLWTAVGKS